MCFRKYLQLLHKAGCQDRQSLFSTWRRRQTLLSWSRAFTKEVDNGKNGVVNSGIIQQALLDMKMGIEHGYTSIVTQCPKITKTSGQQGAPLYINSTSGHFVCEFCNRQGTWQDLKDNLQLLKSQRRKATFECFKDVEAVQPYLGENQSAKEMWNNCVPFSSLREEVVFQVLNAFNMQDIKVSTLDKFGLRCEPRSNQVLLPYRTSQGIHCIKRLRCHKSPDDNVVVRETHVPRTGPCTLFGLDTVGPDVTEVVLTSSELDAMAVSQETRKAAIALPKGYNTLPQEALPSLERFKTIILWFGDDVRAWEMAKFFSKKLNSKRCHIIRPSQEEPGPKTAISQGLKLSTILSKSRPISHESIVSFSQLRQEVLSQLIHTDQVAGVKWKRYPTLNRYLKGHRRGELTVFTGPTGSGKTTFMSDYSLDLCMQGVSTLWGSFEINNVRLGKMMLTQYAQKNLSKRLDLFDYYADSFQMLPLYFMTFHGQENLKKIIDAMTHAVYVHDIAHVILDNLQFMMGVGSDWNDRFVKQDVMVSAFRKFATNMNCHVTLVIHPRKEKETDDLTTSSVFGTAKATQEADNVLILQDKRLTSVRGKKYLQITKNRFDGELGVMLLKFDKDSLSFAVKEKDKAAQKEKEEVGETYPETSVKDNTDDEDGGEREDDRLDEKLEEL